MIEKIALLILSISLTVSVLAQTVTDIDGNIYNTIVLGSQTWMKENLKVTRYQNGDSILTTSPYSLNINSEIGAKYQWAYDGVDSNVINYGRLYTWHAAVDSRKVCPIDWHVPSDAEWDTLIVFSGGIDNARDELVNGDFSALYAGRRHNQGNFAGLNTVSHWWSSDDFEMNSYWKPSISSTPTNNSVEAYGNLFLSRTLGFSVRCIKDNPTLSIDNSESSHKYIIADYYTNKILILPKNVSNPIFYVYNLMGQIVFSKNVEGEHSEINIDYFPNGIYLYILRGDNFAFQMKGMKIN